MEERTLTPGAAISGFIRPLPSIVPVPREEKPDRLLLMSMAPAEKASAWMAGGSITEEQEEPLLPAADTKRIPAALVAARPSSRENTSQPSEGGQPQELFTM